MRKIADLLATGKENAISSRELCKVLNMKWRELQKAVKRERKQGAPICAVCNGPFSGYYLAGSKEEMEEYLARLEHRIHETEATRDACAAAAVNL